MKPDSFDNRTLSGRLIDRFLLCSVIPLSVFVMFLSCASPGAASKTQKTSLSNLPSLNTKSGAQKLTPAPESLRNIKIVYLDIIRKFPEEANRLKLGEDKIALRLLKYAGIKTVKSPTSSKNTATIKIHFNAAPLMMKYAVRNPYNFNPYAKPDLRTQYSGARTYGSITILHKAGERVSHSFDARVDPPKETVLKFYDKDQAPYAKTLQGKGSYTLALMLVLTRLKGASFLKAALRDREPYVKEVAAYQLGNYKDQPGVRASLGSLAKKNNSLLGTAALLALSDSPGEIKKATPFLRYAAARQSHNRALAATLLAKGQVNEAVPDIIKGLKIGKYDYDGDANIILALGKLEHPAVIDGLLWYWKKNLTETHIRVNRNLTGVRKILTKKAGRDLGESYALWNKWNKSGRPAKGEASDPALDSGARKVVTSFRDVKRVKLMIVEDYGDARKTRLPFRKIAKRVLAYAGWKVASPDSDDYDAVLKVASLGTAEKQNYERYGINYTGAELKGKLELRLRGQSSGPGADFSGSTSPSWSISRRYPTPDHAPFAGLIKGRGGFGFALIKAISQTNRVDALTKALRDPDDGVVKIALTTLGETGRAEFIKPIASVMLSGSRYSRLDAIKALARIKDRARIPYLMKALKDNYIAYQVAPILAEYKHEPALPLINRALLKVSSLDERSALARALQVYKDKSSASPLLDFLGDAQKEYERARTDSYRNKYDAYRRDALNALKSVTGQDFGFDVKKWNAWVKANR